MGQNVLVGADSQCSLRSGAWGRVKVHRFWLVKVDVGVVVCSSQGSGVGGGEGRKLSPQCFQMVQALANK